MSIDVSADFSDQEEEEEEYALVNGDGGNEILQSLGKSLASVSQLPTGANNDLNIFDDLHHDGPAASSQGRNTINVGSSVVTPLIDPPKFTEFIIFKYARDFHTDAKLLRAALATPVTRQLGIDWREVHAKMRGTSMGSYTLYNLRTSFAILMHFIDNGQLPWSSVDPREVQEVLRVVSQLKNHALSTGLRAEQVALLHVPPAQFAAAMQAAQASYQARKAVAPEKKQLVVKKFARPTTSESEEPPQLPPESKQVMLPLVVPLIIRDAKVDEELEQRSRSIEEHLNGTLRFIPNVGTFRNKYITLQQQRAMDAIAEADGDVAAAASALKLTPAALERRLDEWVLERRRVVEAAAESGGEDMQEN